MTQPTGYDATLDPRTGRPILPVDAENARKADAVSEPLTDEDNQGIEIGEDVVPEIEIEEEREVEEAPDEAPDSNEGEAIPRPIFSRDEGHAAPSAEDINSTTARMKGPGIEAEESDEDLIDRNV